MQDQLLLLFDCLPCSNKMWGVVGIQLLFEVDFLPFSVCLQFECFVALGYCSPMTSRPESSSGGTESDSAVSIVKRSQMLADSKVLLIQ